MTDAEASRLDLYNRLQEVLGKDPATTLMNHLPASNDLVTAGDFNAFKAEMRQFRAEVNQRFDRVFLAVLAGQFVLLAAIISAAALF